MVDRPRLIKVPAARKCRVDWPADGQTGSGQAECTERLLADRTARAQAIGSMTALTCETGVRFGTVPHGTTEYANRADASLAAGKAGRITGGMYYVAPNDPATGSCVDWQGRADKAHNRAVVHGTQATHTAGWYGIRHQSGANAVSRITDTPASDKDRS